MEIINKFAEYSEYSDIVVHWYFLCLFALHISRAVRYDVKNTKFRLWFYKAGNHEIISPRLTNNSGCAVSLQLATQQKYLKNSNQKHCQPFSPLNKRDKTNKGWTVACRAGQGWIIFSFHVESLVAESESSGIKQLNF